MAVANSGQWPSGVQRVHSGLVLLVVVVVSCSVARCGACCPAPLAPAEWNPPDTVLCCFYSWNRLVARSICESDITLTLDQLELIRWRILQLRGKGWYRCLQEKHQMWAMDIMLQHQNKIRQRNLPRFDQPCNGEDLNYGVGSKSRRQWKSMLLYSDSKQRFELLKEDMMQNHCPFKKQPVNVVLWKRSNTWQRNSETLKSRQMWNWRILTWHFKRIARHLWGDWISTTTRHHVPLWGKKSNTQYAKCNYHKTKFLPDIGSVISLEGLDRAFPHWGLNSFPNLNSVAFFLHFPGVESTDPKSCQIIFVWQMYHICSHVSRRVFSPFITTCPCSPVTLVSQTLTPGCCLLYGCSGTLLKLHTMWFIHPTREVPAHLVPSSPHCRYCQKP